MQIKQVTSMCETRVEPATADRLNDTYPGAHSHLQIFRLQNQSFLGQWDACPSEYAATPRGFSISQISQKDKAKFQNAPPATSDVSPRIPTLRPTIALAPNAYTSYTRRGSDKCLHDRCVVKAAEIQSPKIHKTQKCRTLTSYQPCDNTMPQALSTRSNTQAQYSSRSTDYIRQHDMFEHCTLSGPQHPNPSIRFLSPFATHPSASRESLTPRSSQALSSPRPHSDTKRMTHLTRQSRATAACTSRHDQH